MGMSGPGEIDFWRKWLNRKGSHYIYCRIALGNAGGSREKYCPGKGGAAEAPAGGWTCRYQWRRTAAQTISGRTALSAVPLAFLKMRRYAVLLSGRKKGKKLSACSKGLPAALPCYAPAGTTISTILWQPLPPPGSCRVTDRKSERRARSRSGERDAPGKIIMPAGYNVINDSYNANPTSVAAALDVLADEAGRAGKNSRDGDMLGLVPWRRRAPAVGRLAAKHKLKGLVLIGGELPGLRKLP